MHVDNFPQYIGFPDFLHSSRNFPFQKFWGIFLNSEYFSELVPKPFIFKVQPVPDQKLVQQGVPSQGAAEESREVLPKRCRGEEDERREGGAKRRRK